MTTIEHQIQTSIETIPDTVAMQIQTIIKNQQRSGTAQKALELIDTQFNQFNAINDLIADCTRTKDEILADLKHHINDFQLNVNQIENMQPHQYYVQLIQPDQKIQGIDDQIFKNHHPTIQPIDFTTLTRLLNHYCNFSNLKI